MNREAFYHLPEISPDRESMHYTEMAKVSYYANKGEKKYETRLLFIEGIDPAGSRTGFSGPSLVTHIAKGIKTSIFGRSKEFKKDLDIPISLIISYQRVEKAKN